MWFEVYKRCPECKKAAMYVDFTPEFNKKSPYELVCGYCGYFLRERFATEADAREKADKLAKYI